MAWLPNGDLLAAWYSTDQEVSTALTVLASRLRRGADVWDASSEFFKADGHNMHGSSLFHGGSGTLYHFNGMGSQGVEGWDRLALLMRVSSDYGVTWTAPRAIGPEVSTGHQVIASTLMTGTGLLLQPCDASPLAHGGTVVHVSDDLGRSWVNHGAGETLPAVASGASEGRGVIAGIHASVVELEDGRWFALGRGDAIDGHMPQSESADQGRTWHYTASPFPPIAGGQRLVLRRLREGPLLLVSFAHGDRNNPEAKSITVTDDAGQPFEGYGMFAALSFDEAKTWSIRRLLTPGSGTFDGGAWTGTFTATPTRAEHAGYLAATQSPDGTIHLLSSRLHYRFNYAWLIQGQTVPPAR